MKISVIVPVFNEEGNIDIFYERIITALKNADFSFEVIFIDDGSTDSSPEKINNIVQKDNQFIAVELKRNYGQTAAMMAGFDHASGDIIVPMDGDLQNDPNDIPKLIEMLDKGYDVCSGWRKNRKDNFFLRSLPSRIANSLISIISGVKLHDYGCTLKAYKKEVMENVRLYGEMHRFIPIFASWEGAKIIEVPVNHHPRSHGQSKYGLERIFKVILDLIVVMFFSTFANKPIYIFGGFGLINFILSFFCFGIMVYYKFWGGKSFVETPLPQLAVLFFLMGFIAMLMGFLAEILMRTYYESQGKPVYAVKNTKKMEHDL